MTKKKKAQICDAIILLFKPGIVIYLQGNEGLFSYLIEVKDYSDKNVSYVLKDSNIKFLIADGMLDISDEYQKGITSLRLTDKGIATMRDIKNLGYVAEYRNNNFMNILSKHYRYFWIVFLVVIGYCIIDGVYNPSKKVIFTLDDEPILLTHFLLFSLLLLTITYLILSLKRVEANEIGCVLLFGKPLFQVGPGLAFAPIAFYDLKKETGLVIQERFPEDNAKNSIRIIHGHPDSHSHNPLHTQLTTPVTIVVRYRIVNFVVFIQIIGSREELKKQMRDAIVAKARYEFAKRSVSENLQRIEEINDLLQDSLYDFTKDWGVDLSSVQIESIDTTEIDEALLKIPRAEFDKREAIIKAEGTGEAEKIKREFIGIGDAKAMELMLFAKASGYKEIAKKLNMESGQTLIYVDLISNVLSGAKLNFIGADMNEILKITTAIKNLDLTK